MFMSALDSQESVDTVGDQPRRESSGFINPTIGEEQVEGPQGTPRDINEIRLEALRTMGPILTHQEEEGGIRTADTRWEQGTEES